METKRIVEDFGIFIKYCIKESHNSLTSWCTVQKHCTQTQLASINNLGINIIDSHGIQVKVNKLDLPKDKSFFSKYIV